MSVHAANLQTAGNSFEAKKHLWGRAILSKWRATMGLPGEFLIRAFAVDSSSPPSGESPV